MAYENEKIEESMFEFECELDKALTYYAGELALVKAGRANPKILDKITIDYYDTPTPINQIAGISVPEARMIVISPWDHTQLKPIVKAIQTSDIGITPMDDGKVIRLIFTLMHIEQKIEQLLSQKWVLMVEIIKSQYIGLNIYLLKKLLHLLYSLSVAKSATIKLLISLHLMRI